MSRMSQRDRAILAVLGVLLLWGVAAFAWFAGQERAWRAAEKRYRTAREQRISEDKLIREKAKWNDAYENERAKMPRFGEDDRNVDTHWLDLVGDMAKSNHVYVAALQAKDEESSGDVYVRTLDLKNCDASLKCLVQFLYGLQTAEGTMIDVSTIDVRPNNQHKGFLRVNFTLGCAYMRGE